MIKEDFLKNFTNQFDETDASELTFETNFKELDEWSSLLSLAIMNMVGKKYNVKLKPDDMQVANTIQELYDLVYSKI